MLLVVKLDGRRHDRNGFDCGVSPLNLYLQQRASQHHRDGVATTHVLIEDGEPARILGFYTLAAAQMSLNDLAPDDRRRLPKYPVPAARLARLAVALQEQGHGLGEAMMQDVVKRCLLLRGELGVRVLLVDAKDDQAADYCATFGFRLIHGKAHSLYLPLGNA